MVRGQLQEQNGDEEEEAGSVLYVWKKNSCDCLSSFSTTTEISISRPRWSDSSRELVFFVFTVKSQTQV